MSWVDAIKAGDFNGSWCGVDGEAVANIAGQQITFPDGHVARLEARSKEVVCMVMDGEVFSARLDQPGILKWNDGDVWMLREALIPDSPEEGGSQRSDSEATELQKELQSLRKEASSLCEAEASNSSPDIVSSNITRPQRPAPKTRKKKTNIIVSEPGSYRVLQGMVFKKPGDDPTIDKGFKQAQDVGSTLRTTGRSWKGKNGATWVEVDSPCSPGWVLTSGEGVGMPGPLLQKVEEGEAAPFILRVKSPKADDLDDQAPIGERKFILKPNASIREVKSWISLLFKLNIAEIRICKPQDQRPSNGKYVVWHNLGNDEFVPDDRNVEEAGFSDGCLIHYIYVGFLPD